MLKISDCSSIALNQDPQAFSHEQANLGIGAPYCSSSPMGTNSRLLQPSQLGARLSPGEPAVHSWPVCLCINTSGIHGNK